MGWHRGGCPQVRSRMVKKEVQARVKCLGVLIPDLRGPNAGSKTGSEQGRIQRGGSGARSPSPMTRGAPAPKAQKRQYPSFFANNNQRAALRANRAQSLVGG